MKSKYKGKDTLKEQIKKLQEKKQLNFKHNIIKEKKKKTNLENRKKGHIKKKTLNIIL